LELVVPGGWSVNGERGAEVTAESSLIRPEAEVTLVGSPHKQVVLTNLPEAFEAP